MLSPFVLSLKKTVSLVKESSDRAVLQSPLIPLTRPRIELNLEGLSPGVRNAIEVLAADGGTEASLTDLVVQTDGFLQLPKFYYYLEKFIHLGLLCYTLQAEGFPLATLVPISPEANLELKQAAKEQEYILSRFAYIHSQQAEMVLESPLSHAQIILNDSQCATLIAELAKPQRAGELCQNVAGISPETIQNFFSLLLTANMLYELNADGKTSEAENQTLVQWEFHDLLFHSRSRAGRHSNAMGKTYRFLGQFSPQPVVKPPMSDERIDLYKPDLAQLNEEDACFSLILEQRQSVRSYDDEAPITAKQLGEFLYRSARIKRIFPKDYGECSNRPFVDGGTCYEFELYPVINLCDGIASGLYHYCPKDHQLERLSGRTSQVEELLKQAQLTSFKMCMPQILIAIAARFPRVTWNYESIAYATILKNLGALYQTLYLVATSMKIAPCAIGAGNADLFAAAAGTDYYAESSVGEFLLGSRPRDYHHLDL
jgi:SagB-type dehydrogenase family enzyme